MTGYNRFIHFQKMGWHGLAVVFVLDDINRLVSVDLIGKRNQVRFELNLYHYDTGLKRKFLEGLTST